MVAFPKADVSPLFPSNSNSCVYLPSPRVTCIFVFFFMSQKVLRTPPTFGLKIRKSEDGKKAPENNLVFNDSDSEEEEKSSSVDDDDVDDDDDDDDEDIEDEDDIDGDNNDDEDMETEVKTQG